MTVKIDYQAEFREEFKSRRKKLGLTQEFTAKKITLSQIALP